jgi:ribosomal protein S18 acetylase RimI-like enzyme
MATIVLQGITIEEQDEFLEMVTAYWKELVPDAPVARDPRRAAAYFAEHFRFGDDSAFLWWAMSDAVKVGFVRVELWLTEDERGGFVRDFYIRPDVRRQGLGTAVVQAIRSVAERDGWVRIDLNVREDNPSGLAFWQSQGFNLQLYQLRQYIGRDTR